MSAMDSRFLFPGLGLSSNNAGQSASSSTTASSSSAIPVQEFAVRVPKNSKKRYHVMRFHATLNVDVAKWTQVKMERENNLKDFKADEDMPKFGAGSEYGREAREEARRKKFGVQLKKYNPEDQPWLLRMGGKAGKKYRGLREGGVAENASYYVFVKAQDGAFEAYPVEEWYNFSAVQRYKTLNAEEAEEEFGRRDKVLNYFSIMLRKRLKNEEDGEKDPEEAEKPKKKPSKYGMGTGELKISDQDEWIHSSDEESDEEGVAEDAADSKPKDKKKKDAGKKKGKKKKKKGSDDDDDEDEPLEDSDDGDGEGREVDYISDEESSEEEVVEGKSKNELKGVEDEDGMRKMHDSESEEEKEEEKKENQEETPGETPPAKAAKDKKDSKKAASSSDSSSDTSDSDDFDSDANFQSPMFMQSSKKKKDGSRPSSRANTPTNPSDGSKKSRSHKRKAAAEDGSGSGPQPKRSKSQPSSASSSQQNTSSSSRPSPSPYADLSNDGITEDAVRRYLIRKPMTTTELLQKFKSKKTGLSREQMVNTIAQILKRLDPERQMVKGKMYLSIK